MALFKAFHRRCALLLPLAAVALAGFPAVPAGAELLISPAAIKLELDEGRPNGTITLTNAGKETTRLRARAVHFVFSENGSLAFAPPDGHSLAPWIRFNPTEFEMAPESKQVVRYTLLVPPGIQPADYWGAIEFEGLDVHETQLPSEDGKTMTVKVITSTLVMMQGKKGDPSLSFQILGGEVDTSGDSPLVRVRVKNTGRGRVDPGGTYELLDGAGAVVAKGELPRTPVFPEWGRLLSAPLATKLDGGAYRLHVRLEAPQMSSRPIEGYVDVTLRN